MLPAPDSGVDEENHEQQHEQRRPEFFMLDGLRRLQIGQTAGIAQKLTSGDFHGFLEQ